MAAGAVLEAGEATFGAEVVERSRELPVVVDFWAPWCGPCRVLGPLLETLAAECADAVRVVKVNVDEHPGLAARYGVRGIPAVKAFRGGEVVGEFTGALPEPRVREFFASLVPSAADRAAAEGARALEAGDRGAARLHLERALAEQPGHRGAAASLAALLLDEGDREGARALAAPLAGEPAADRALARIAFLDGAGDGDRAALEARIAAAPDDAAAHYALGCLLASEGEWEPALERLLATVRLDRGLADDGGRRRMLDAFGLLGDGHELTRTWRARLANVIF